MQMPQPHQSRRGPDTGSPTLLDVDSFSWPPLRCASVTRALMCAPHRLGNVTRSIRPRHGRSKSAFRCAHGTAASLWCVGAALALVRWSDLARNTDLKRYAARRVVHAWRHTVQRGCCSSTATGRLAVAVGADSGSTRPSVVPPRLRSKPAASTVPDGVSAAPANTRRRVRCSRLGHSATFWAGPSLRGAPDGVGNTLAFGVPIESWAGGNAAELTWSRQRAVHARRSTVGPPISCAGASDVQPICGLACA